MTGIISPLETSDDGQTPDPTPEQLAQAPGDAQVADIAGIRDLVLRAHPDVVPELITGTSVAELLSSIEPARAAYGRLIDAVRSGQAQAVPVPAVPAGGSAPVPIGPDRLPPAEKIRRGLQVRST
jgi:hypothetical protein